MRLDCSDTLIGNTIPIERLRRQLRRTARSDCSVVITGETGTGKELVATLVHESSARSRRPFVCVNCAAIPDSLLEAELFGYERGAFTGAVQRNEGRMGEANTGTLFLDEIGDMSLHAQAKLLRAVETRRLTRLGGRGSYAVDLRIVAATNQDLESLVAAHQFRKDLFYRLNVVRMRLPPLREIREDIPDLAEHFLRRLHSDERRRPHLSDSAMAGLLRHDWPGNVRELRNAVEVALLNADGDQIELRHLPEEISEPAAKNLDDKSRILEALETTNWNKSEAAKRLSWSRMTLYRKMARYDICPDSQYWASHSA